LVSSTTPTNTYATSPYVQRARAARLVAESQRAAATAASAAVGIGEAVGGGRGLGGALPASAIGALLHRPRTGRNRSSLDDRSPSPSRSYRQLISSAPSVNRSIESSSLCLFSTLLCSYCLNPKDLAVPTLLIFHPSFASTFSLLRDLVAVATSTSTSTRLSRLCGPPRHPLPLLLESPRQHRPPSRLPQPPPPTLHS
jgi:hypothetical protein